MAHNIKAIITSFKYEGERPNVVLVGNFHLITVDKRYGINFSEAVLEPYKELTSKTRKQLKEFSFKGKCAYIETHYFGGQGYQISEVWHNGKRIAGPMISFDGTKPKILSGVTLVEESINESLKIIGIYKHEDKDEFDSVRLSDYRTNDEIIREYKLTKQ